MDQTKLHFVLSGFNEELGFRIFTFDGIAPDYARTSYTVKIDLALARQYGIRLQELPLLCRALLDRSYGSSAFQAFTYPEAEMSNYANAAAARQEAARNKKPPRRPAAATEVGSAWRTPGLRPLVLGSK